MNSFFGGVKLYIILYTYNTLLQMVFDNQFLYLILENIGI